MNRKMYKMTTKDLNKCQRELRYGTAEMERVEANKSKLGRKYGLRKRDAARRLLKGSPEYVRGLWQGRIDAARGLNYSEERLESAYNMGYHTGYINYASNIHGGLVIPTEYLEA